IVLPEQRPLMLGRTYTARNAANYLFLGLDTYQGFMFAEPGTILHLAKRVEHGHMRHVPPSLQLQSRGSGEPVMTMDQVVARALAHSKRCDPLRELAGICWQLSLVERRSGTRGNADQPNPRR